MYRKHVFVCENRRDEGACCAARVAEARIAAEHGGVVKFMRARLREVQQHGKGKVRVNRAGCFDRCDEGPMLVIYPAARWYRYQSVADLEEIIAGDILADNAVTRLQIER